MKHIMRGALVALLGLVVASAGSRSDASVIMVLQAGQPVASASTPGAFDWTYDATLQVDQQLQADDYFSIIDFPGLLAVSSSNPLITASIVATTPTPTSQVYPDSPAILNALWTVTGTIGGGVGSDIGNFIVTSSLGGPPATLLFQTAQAHKETIQGSGNYDLLAGNTTQVQGPAGAVPEPSTVALAGLGGVIGLLSLRRRKATA